MDGPPARLIDGDQQPVIDGSHLVGLIHSLNPRRKYDLEHRPRFLAATSEGWAEPIYLALADLVAASQAD